MRELHIVNDRVVKGKYRTSQNRWVAVRKTMKTWHGMYLSRRLVISLRRDQVLNRNSILSSERGLTIYPHSLRKVTTISVFRLFLGTKYFRTFAGVSFTLYQASLATGPRCDRGWPPPSRVQYSALDLHPWWSALTLYFILL